MQVSDQSRSVNSRQIKLQETLRILQRKLELDNAQFLNYFGIHDKTSVENATLSALEKIANKINVTLEHLLSGNLESSNIFQPQDKTPENYSQFTTSKNLAVDNILGFLEKRYPLHHNSITRELGLNNKMFQDPNGHVSISLINHIYRIMQNYNFPTHIFEDIGFSSIDKFKKQTSLLTELEEINNRKKLFELFINEVIKKIDNTWSYKITSFKENYFIIQAAAKEETIHHFKTALFGNMGICNHRAGVIKAISHIFHNHEVEVTEQKCIHHGAPFCEYKTTFLGKKATPLSFSKTYLQ